MLVNTTRIKVILYPLTIAYFQSVSAHIIIKWIPRQEEPLKCESFFTYIWIHTDGEVQHIHFLGTRNPLFPGKKNLI